MWVHWLVTKPSFDMFIMFVIMLSSAALAAEDPVEEHSPTNIMLGYFDYGFTAIFGIECFIKVGIRKRMTVTWNPMYEVGMIDFATPTVFLFKWMNFFAILRHDTCTIGPFMYKSSGL